MAMERRHRKRRAATGAHQTKIKPSIRPFERAAVRFSEMCSCGDTSHLKFLFNLLKFCKNDCFN